MKGVLILSELFPDQEHPGKGMFVRGQAEELSQRIPVNVIAPIAVPLPMRRFKLQREAASLVPRRSIVSEARLFRPRYFDFPRFSTLMNSRSMFVAAVKCIIQERLSFDVLHCHRIFPEGYVGVLLGSFLKKPVCVTIHGQDFNHFAAPRPLASSIYGGSPKGYSLIRRSMLYALRKADKLIPVSEEIRDRVLELGVDGRKIVVIRNGVDLRRFRTLGREEARRALGLETDAKIVLFVGNLIPRKDPETLIRAFREVRAAAANTVLVMVGRGPLKEQLTGYVAACGLEGVRFLDEIADEAVPLWMNASDVLVMPSVYESFGCVLLEALACGTPIITTCTGALPEVYAHGQHGFLVQPGQPDDLASAILSAFVTKWDIDGLVAFAQRHSWSKICDQIFSEYETVLRNSGATKR